MKQQVLAERRFAPGLAQDALPALAAAQFDVAPGRIAATEVVLDGQRYIELVAPVGRPKASTRMPPSEPADTGAGAAGDGATAPIGVIRIGMSLETQRKQFREQLVGAIGVIGLLVVFAILATLLLTRRLVAPMRRLMRAARAVGSGRLDVYVPAHSSDELGLLTHTFNHMTQKLAESQSEVANYQRTLEEKVAQRTRELEVATAHAYKLAQHDILTGLPNRSLLNQRLRQILAQAQRDGTHVACLFIDFDHFKRINDTLGHDAGDQLLQAIAQRLTSAVRESDTVARLGGDEFVLILPGLDPEPAMFEVMTVLTRVRDAFEAPFRLGDQTPTLRCSIGVALYPGDAQDGVGLIKQADTAMYAAKDAGRNAYRFFTADMNARVQLRLQLETDMRRGLMDDEFFLVYQPQIEMQTGRACGVEALLRWRDPERGVIGPNEFIPIAEESGMIQALGARVLRDACRQVVQWHRHDMPLRLSVNLSVQQLQHDSWLSVVEDALRGSGLARALPRPRDHRERDHHAPRKGGRDAHEAEADGRIDHDRRLRHRLLEPVVPCAPADPERQDRPAVRARARAQPERRGDHAGDHRAVALAGPALHRRGRRDAGAVQLPARARLRGSAGLPDRAPADRGRPAFVVAHPGGTAPGPRAPGRPVAGDGGRLNPGSVGRASAARRRDRRGDRRRARRPRRRRPPA